MTVYVAITGASGAIYAARAIEALRALDVSIWASVSPTAAEIVRAQLYLHAVPFEHADVMLAHLAR